MYEIPVIKEKTVEPSTPGTSGNRWGLGFLLPTKVAGTVVPGTLGGETLTQTLITSWASLGLEPLVGPIYLDQAPRGSALPYVVMQLVDSRPTFNTGARYFDRSVMRFQIVCDTESKAIEYGTILKNKFMFHVPLDFGTINLVSRVKAMRLTGSNLFREQGPWTGGKPRVRSVLVYDIPVIKEK